MSIMWYILSEVLLVVAEKGVADGLQSQEL